MLLWKQSDARFDRTAISTRHVADLLARSLPLTLTAAVATLRAVLLCTWRRAAPDRTEVQGTRLPAACVRRCSSVDAENLWVPHVTAEVLILVSVSERQWTRAGGLCA
jgi:hypothetical protein